MADRPISQRLVPDLLSFQDSPIVELVVGKEKVSFMVHKKPLCRAAAFFTKALQTDFKESHKRRIKLPEDNLLLYFNSYDLPGTGNAVFTMLIKLYLFANKYFTNGLKQDIIQVMFYYYGEDWTLQPLAM
ncbi:uncharacterized protein HMPREF1541_08454 [Cyphellophora europaea CBS 101466]|uniref:BTB domain-containing protein n=1 Tax=Cyphellophora europaea (strain CBS 101466) TaxID=1220924 RepID=W2RI26_CYPE1|nr:uncharacterized protein HMPREF1541_08454 [Cyphellophora europaea CBS 101466]ETN36177.1 hypothetical protein HMPREF1541_08454 [Cyphellophora europaea CBS 101466]